MEANGGKLICIWKDFARISLYFMLDPVQPWESENGRLELQHHLQLNQQWTQVAKISFRADSLEII